MRFHDLRSLKNLISRIDDIYTLIFIWKSDTKCLMCAWFSASYLMEAPSSSTNSLSPRMHMLDVNE